MGAAVLARFGGVDVLVNAAGINVRGGASTRCRSTTGMPSSPPTSTAPTTACGRSFPGMRERRTGTIVNINSDVGKVARDIAGPAYVSSKFGLMGLTSRSTPRNAATACARARSVPRDVNTPLLDKRPQPPSPEARARMLQPEDLAACVWLVATLPPRAIVDEISLSTR